MNEKIIELLEKMNDSIDQMSNDISVIANYFEYKYKIEFNQEAWDKKIEEEDKRLKEFRNKNKK